MIYSVQVNTNSSEILFFKLLSHKKAFYSWWVTCVKEKQNKGIPNIKKSRKLSDAKINCRENLEGRKLSENK